MGRSKKVSLKPSVHPSAIVDAGVKIGNSAKIWHFCHIQEGAKLGKNCVLGQNVNIGPGVEIGSGTKIQNNVSVYEGVTLEDNVFVGPSVVFTNVDKPRAEFRAGQYTKTLVCQGATIGANATIVCGITIGRYAFIGAGAVVTKDVPEFGLFIGNPARQVGWVCRCGERLRFSGHNASCEACGRTYRSAQGKLQRSSRTRST